MTPALPQTDGLDISALVRMFSDVTNSYKFLFFFALLDRLERNSFDFSIPISLNGLAVEMLVSAWYPHVYFHLSFGKQDQLSKHLDEIAPRDDFRPGQLKPSDKAAISLRIQQGSSHKQLAEIMRYVPYRLIRTFFSETGGIKDHTVNSRVAECCELYFPSSTPPPYRFSSSQDEIIVHPIWAEYFHSHLGLIKAWASWHYLQYMQSCNPNVPAVATKLFAPDERASLAAPTKFWRLVLAKQPMNCIYSKQAIDTDSFALDHFVPWSFVVHNRSWNLLPTSKSINSKKSDCLPASKYIDEFVNTQHSVLTAAHQLLSNKAITENAWEDHVSPFIADLGLAGYSAVLDRDELSTAYDRTLRPLLQLAEVNGFKPNWQYAQEL